jgi:signal transduction histidine kinase
LRVISSTFELVSMIKTLKQLAFDLRLRAGYATAFILLLVSYFLTLLANHQLIEKTKWVNHTNEVIKNLEGLSSGIKDAETGVRGYIITKDSIFLSPYKTALPLVDSLFSWIKTAATGNEIQQKNLAALGSLIKRKHEKLEFALYYFPKNKFVLTDSVAMVAKEGRLAMDSIRTTINNMRSVEENLLAARIKDVAGRYRILNIIIISSLFLALVFAVLGVYAYRREYAARQESDKIVSAYQKELQQRIIELDSANRELILMKRSEKFAATGRIARTIAHEVRNPLTNIDLAVSQIKNESAGADETGQMLFTMIERNSRRINQLISELLSATRFAELTYASVSINTLLDDALDMARDRLELYHITVEKNYSIGICNISVDAEKIKIAFLNLIVNAIEAMEPGKGILKIQTKEEENKCVVEITDNGCGMTEEQLNNLFEPYFTTKAKGNGLGLTNTQNIILNHRGSINVSSKPGKGSSFIIKFDFSPSV